MGTCYASASLMQVVYGIVNMLQLPSSLATGWQFARCPSQISCMATHRLPTAHALHCALHCRLSTSTLDQSHLLQHQTTFNNKVLKHQWHLLTLQSSLQPVTHATVWQRWQLWLVAMMILQA